MTLPAYDKSALFLSLVKRAELPPPFREYRFDDRRRWRFDYAWPDVKIALEVEGGVWTRGRHTRGSGFMRDMTKYNTAALLGWRVFRTTPDLLTNLDTVNMLAASMAARK